MNQIQPYEQVFLDSKAWEMAWKQAEIFVQSGFLPKAIKTKEQCFTIMLMGSELGLSPMTALNNISVINGKPTLEAKLMLSLVKRKYPQSYFRIITNTFEKAEIEIGHNKGTAGKFSFTYEQAKHIGLTNKDNWKNYPADMCLWRAISKGCRVMFPEVLTVASHTAEELETIEIKPQSQSFEPQKLPEKTKNPISINDEDIITNVKEILTKEVDGLMIRGIDIKSKINKDYKEITDKISSATTVDELKSIKAIVAELKG